MPLPPSSRDPFPGDTPWFLNHVTSVGSAHCPRGLITLMAPIADRCTGRNPDLIGGRWSVMVVSKQISTAEPVPSSVLRSRTSYEVAPEGLLTFLGSLYKEVSKTASGTLVYRLERQTARKKKKNSSSEKHCLLD